MREPAIDGTLPMVLASLSGTASPEVDRTAVAAVEAVLGFDKGLPYWTREVLKLVIARFGDPVPERWLGPCGEVCFDPDPADLRSGWQSARRELGIPVVAPLEVRSRRIRRVGGDTPD